MIQSIPVSPSEEFTPYLLRQAGLRASLLMNSFGFAADDWDDLRQDLALDCIRRLPKFDAARGDWKGFVRGVVRNHACVLASRQIRRPEIRPLQIDAESSAPDGGFHCELHDKPGADTGIAFELSLDTQRVLASLPEELRTIARYLTELPISAVQGKVGLSRSQVQRKVARIRSAFLAAGISGGGSNRGGK